MSSSESNVSLCDNTLCPSSNSCVMCNTGNTCENSNVNITENFLYSNDENAKALIIGINYIGQQGQLNGCINDTANIKNTLLNKCNYKEENIVILTDNTEITPTKENMMNAMKSFVKNITESNTKTAWFSFSGHGYYIQDVSMDDVDGHDEVLVPLDYAEKGIITDDELYDVLIKGLPLDCKLFSLIDSCHSGTALDLPLRYNTTTETCSVQKESDCQLANVIKLSGCRDSQTSADAWINGQYQGALTATFLESLGNWSSITLLKHIHTRLQDKFTQLPVLTCTNELCIKSAVLPHVDEPKNVRINLTVDYWHYESTWNILDMTNANVVFSKNQHFSQSFANTIMDLYLKPGIYLLYILDQYGDGGVHGSVSHLSKGKLIDVNFNSNKYFSTVFEI